MEAGLFHVTGLIPVLGAHEPWPEYPSLIMWKLNHLACANTSTLDGNTPVNLKFHKTPSLQLPAGTENAASRNARLNVLANSLALITKNQPEQAAQRTLGARSPGEGLPHYLVNLPPKHIGTHISRTTKSTTLQETPNHTP